MQRDWQPKQYLQFEKERTQPSIDLVNRIGIDSPKRIIDIGCGPGNSTAVLQNQWPNAEVVGVDNSASMLQDAKQKYEDIEFLLHDITTGVEALGQYDIVFSNAALQWMGEHERLLPELFSLVAPGGVLAVQVPYVRPLPIYNEIMLLVKEPKWQPYFETLPTYPMHYPFTHYYDILCDLPAQLSAWQTDYLHILPSHDAVVQWYKGSGLRPFLNKLPNEAMQNEFIAAYKERIQSAYPAQKDGNVILPFTRIFFIVENNEG